ncbi:MAG: hypothetical protein JKY27_12455 [Magnetovibrio sp.]|nr:hypothetical protein [Magnetovibrio sp.]
MKLNQKLALSAVVLFGLPSASLALEAYSPALQDQFTGWCTEQSYSAQVCGCAVSQAAVQIPAVALTSFLASAEGQGTAALSSSVSISAVQIITTCAATSSRSGTGTGDALKAVSGLFGN